MKKTRRVSEHFRLGKSQAELDFVDVPIPGDIRLYVDPFALSLQNDPWFVEANNLVVDFFERTIQALQKGDDAECHLLLSNLHEPQETHLGQSQPHTTGRGVGDLQADQLLEKLKNSKAAKTGRLSELSDCELLIPGISNDKISDITINVIRGKLIEYTQSQCALLGIPMQEVAAKPTWDDGGGRWVSGYASLPIVNGAPVIFVPKSIVRFRLAADQNQFYRHFVLNYLQREHLDANSSLVHVLKNGKRVVTKKVLMVKYPQSKEFLGAFSDDHPMVLEKYREMLADKDYTPTAEQLEAARRDSRETDWEGLANELQTIPKGRKDADRYHNHIIGVLTAVFDGHLRNPKKEQPINEGRKKIDITFNRGPLKGFFYELQVVHGVPCPYVHFECKNYSEDPANPEFDQLIGRFSERRGKLGFLVCRTIENRKLVTQRCRDAALQGQGIIIVLDDRDLTKLLKLRRQRRFNEIDDFLDARYRDLVM
jgi:hypothetical protein